MKEGLDIETSYACEIIGRLVADYSHIFEKILDDMGEDCYEEVKNFLRKAYTDMELEELGIKFQI